jgi:threonine aldolase
MIDLRSDTVTRPTAGMREAIARAEVGDDVFDEDPTIHLLQERVAALLGKEATLFVPSGSMANTTAVLTHTVRGDEILVEEGSHVFNYESGASATLGSPGPDDPGSSGAFTLEQMIERIRPVNPPPADAARLHGEHAQPGGRDDLPDLGDDAIGPIAAKGLRTHLDGARFGTRPSRLGRR